MNTTNNIEIDLRKKEETNASRRNSDAFHNIKRFKQKNIHLFWIVFGGHVNIFQLNPQYHFILL